MKKIGELEKRLEALEPKDDLAEYRKLLDEIKKVMPEKEYVPYPYPYPWYPYQPTQPWYPVWTGTTTGTNYTLAG